MNIKRSQLKEVIKQVVRESIQERKYQSLLKEVSPPGKKAESMIQHVKTSLRKSHPEWSDDKIASVAIATAWKNHKKGNVEEAGENIPKGKLAKLNPNIVKGGSKKLSLPKQKKVKEAGLTSEDDRDPSDDDDWNTSGSDLAAYQASSDMKHRKTTTSPDDHWEDETQGLHGVEEASGDTSKVQLIIDLAAQKGLSDDVLKALASKAFTNAGEVVDDSVIDDIVSKALGAVQGGEEGGDIDGALGGEEHKYEEGEELELIKMIKKTAEDLLAMHGASSEPESPEMEEPGEDEGGEAAEEPPAFLAGGEESEEAESEPEGDDDDDDDKEEVDEAAYKIVSPNQTDTAKEYKARKIQTEPKVSENFKVQTGPSCRTSKDSKDNPKNVRSPKLP